MAGLILVTGGTGTIGRRVVPLLSDAGRDVRALSRHPSGDGHVGGDTVSGRGLDEAMDGVGTVVHLAGGARGDDVAAVRVAAAARRAGVGHVVLISVIGADRMPIGYFRAKAAAERAIAESGVPWTMLRSAQLHDFVFPLVRGLGRMPVTLAPRGLRFDPVAVEEVAARLAEIALGEPAGRVADFAGPEVLDVAAMVAQNAAVRGRRQHPVVHIPLPGAIGRAYRAGDNLASDDAQRGVGTWREFIAERADSLSRARR